MGIKICTKCNIQKTFNDYHKLHKGKDGLQSVCKECRKRAPKDLEALRNKYKSDTEYRVNKLQKCKEYRDKNKDNKDFNERRKKSRDKYRLNNKEKLKCINIEYRKKNEVKIKEYHRKNKDRANEMRRRYRNKTNDGFVIEYKKECKGMVDGLKDRYVISILAKKLKISRAAMKEIITPNIIHQEKELIKLNRAIKNHDNKQC